MANMNELSPNVQAKVVGHFMAIRALSGVMIGAAVCVIITGIVQVSYVYSNDVKEWPINSGIAIWGGVEFMAVGILGVVLSCSHCSKPLYVIHSILNSLSYTFAGLMVGWNATVGVACMNGKPEKPWCHDEDMQVHISLAWIIFAFAVVQAMLALPVSITYCMINRAMKGCNGNRCCAEANTTTTTAVAGGVGGAYDNGGYGVNTTDGQLPPKAY